MRFHRLSPPHRCATLKIWEWLGDYATPGPAPWSIKEAGWGLASPAGTGKYTWHGTLKGHKTTVMIPCHIKWAVYILGCCITGALPLFHFISSRYQELCFFSQTYSNLFWCIYYIIYSYGYGSIYTWSRLAIISIERIELATWPDYEELDAVWGNWATFSCIGICWGPAANGRSRNCYWCYSCPKFHPSVEGRMSKETHKWKATNLYKEDQVEFLLELHFPLPIWPAFSAFLHEIYVGLFSIDWMK